MLAGRYRVEEAVGRGGSAVVHRGWDRTLKRRVAVKVFSSYRADGDEPSAEVLREARTAAGLNHPNVARVYDYGEATEGSHRVPYLVMEFIDGDTLADRIAREGALPWPEAAMICAATAAALATAHERDLVHRDIKPRNVMLPSGGGVKVVDFGIAAAAGQNSVDTQGNLWGTPVSLAPEQLRGEPTYPAADIYALGLVLFECLVGRAAWQGSSVGEILAQRHNNPAPRLPRISGLPREIVKLYEACTADKPEQRPTAAEARAVLRRAAGLVPTLRPQISLLPAVPRAAGTLVTAAPAATTVAAPETPAAPSRPAGLLPKYVLSRSRPPGSRPQQQRSRRRAAAVASMAVATAVVSVLGLQLANGTANPGGRTAEAAVDGAAIAPTPQPIDTPPLGSASPRATTPTPTATTTAPVYAVPVDRTTRDHDSDNDDDYDPTKPPKSSKPTTKPTDDPTDPSESTPPTSPDPSTPTDDDPTDDPTTDPTDPDEPHDPESTPTPDDPTDDPTTDPETTPTGDHTTPPTGDGGVSGNSTGSSTGTGTGTSTES